MLLARVLCIFGGVADILNATRATGKRQLLRRSPVFCVRAMTMPTMPGPSETHASGVQRMENRTRKSIYELLQADHYTPREVAELLEIGEHTVQNAVFEGELPAQIVDHDIISIRRDDVVAWFHLRYGSS
jgi:helix-turn-helix protein